jgi:hypothetical protein
MQGLYGYQCEQLWQSWLRRTMDVPSSLHTMFDLEAAPEPYVNFGAGANPLVELLTNPGYVLPEQTRGVIESGAGPIKSVMDYATVAKTFGEFYERQLRGAAAHRIAAIRSLSEQLGFDGVLQVDACPFHSASLPNKGAVLRIIRAGGLLGQYAGTLREFLRSRPVLTLAAVSSAHPLLPPPVLTDWARWQAQLAGLDLEQAKFLPLVKKGNATTVAALISRADGVPKGLVLMMGGNRLPGPEGLRTLAAFLR